MAEWFISDMRMRLFDNIPCAGFTISYIGQHSGKAYEEYVVAVHKDGTWNCWRNFHNGWKPTNGVIEELEPLFYGTLPKAQALAILKG